MLLSVVIPVYNEEDGIPALLARLHPVVRGLACDYELVFINDGSTDGSGALLEILSETDKRIKLLNFSRHLGRPAAITAGLEFAGGDAVAVMAADLEDPPEILPEMLRLIRRGNDVVSAERHQQLTSETHDFRMFSRDAVLALRTFHQPYRSMSSLVI